MAACSLPPLVSSSDARGSPVGTPAPPHVLTVNDEEGERKPRQNNCATSKSAGRTRPRHQQTRPLPQPKRGVRGGPDLPPPGPPVVTGLGFIGNRPSRCNRLRASLRARRIASAF